MASTYGTISIGVKAPVIREGDNVAQMVADSVMKASKQLRLPIEKGDVIAITESIVARGQGNYVTVDEIAANVAEKFGNAKIGIVFPILSRNRFSMLLKGICRGAKGGVVLLLNLPADEVGNHLVSEEEWNSSFVRNLDVITEEQYHKAFGRPKHKFTGIDYVEYYKCIAAGEGCDMEILFAERPQHILPYTRSILCCDIHTRERTKAELKEYGVERIYTLADICCTQNMSTGYNVQYGLLGSNKADEERVKLFPHDADGIVHLVQYLIYRDSGVDAEVMVYGDGAFKDPVGGIWELADPVVGVAYTSGLKGRPNELKLKALADGKYKELSGETLKEAIKEEIKSKEKNLVGNMASQGTTPRQLTDLLGSLADLTSGSGDKGTPIVWIKNYFSTYAD
ncbi:MAG: coenzyme F420-0:L-glutamate ligase [Clostridia bacterium]|nr:coenzyme F420-0:L-glutamate ligase [Clostridia bacterium]